MRIQARLCWAGATVQGSESQKRGHSSLSEASGRLLKGVSVQADRGSGSRGAGGRPAPWGRCVQGSGLVPCFPSGHLRSGS